MDIAQAANIPLWRWVRDSTDYLTNRLLLIREDYRPRRAEIRNQVRDILEEMLRRDTPSLWPEYSGNGRSSKSSVHHEEGVTT